MTRSQRLLMIAFVVPVTIALDQWTKHIVLNTPAFNALGCLDRSQRCGQIEVSSFFDWSMVWNRGMSFGTLQSEGIMRWVLVVMTGIIIIGFTVWLFQAATRLTSVALALLVAGALGNLIDRIRYGAVVDFIDVSDGLPFFPWVFNVADSAITVGAALLLLDQFILSRQDAKEQADG